MCAPQVPASMPSIMNWTRVAQRARARADSEWGAGWAEVLVEVVIRCGLEIGVAIGLATERGILPECAYSCTFAKNHESTSPSRAAHPAPNAGRGSPTLCRRAAERDRAGAA